MAKSQWYKHKGICPTCRGASAVDLKPGTKSTAPLCVKCNLRTQKRHDGTCEKCYAQRKLTPVGSIRATVPIVTQEQVDAVEAAFARLVAVNDDVIKFKPKSPEACNTSALFEPKKNRTVNSGDKIWGKICKRCELQKAGRWIMHDGICTTCHKITEKIEVQGAERGGCKVYKDETVKLPDA